MVFQSDTQPLCRYCGKPIKKHTSTVYFVKERSALMRDSVHTRHIVGSPTTKAEAQRMVNEQIVSVRRGTMYQLDPAIVGQVSLWDGVSYEDEFFCNGTHAQRFAYVMARTGQATVAYADATKKTNKGETK